MTGYNKHIDNRFNELKWLNYYNENNEYKNIIHKRSWEEWNIMMNSRTGFLIIDAAIQEIKSTGYMHNRARMIVGCFNVKYLLINPLCPYIGLNVWFSRYLLDCCTTQNKLNCQWLTELDYPGKKYSAKGSIISGRPMNISNEIIKKFDPECVYIKKWLPHLKDIDYKILYNWDKKYDNVIHPGPIFDPRERYKEWINICKD